MTCYSNVASLLLGAMLAAAPSVSQEPSPVPQTLPTPQAPPVPQTPRAPIVLPAAQAPAAPATIPTPQTPPVPLATPPPAAPDSRPARGGPRTSLDVQVTIVRSLGGKVLSRLPNTLTVVTGAPASQLNMGAEVPVPSTTLTAVRPATPRPAQGGTPGQPVPAPEPAGPPVQSVSYRNVGTVITCSAAPSEGAVHELTLTVDDSAVLPRDAADTAQVGPGLPAFRSFRSRNTLLLRDGQVRTFTVAADRVSGEEVQVEVKLTVLK